MFKKSVVLTIITALFFIIAPQGTFAGSVSPIVNKSALDRGILSIDYSNSKGAKALVRISKGNVKYDYPFEEGAWYPLQLGNGNYNVLIAESTGKNKYRVIAQESMDVEMEDENAVYLQSIPLIDWNDETKAVVQAKKTAGEAKTDADKIAAIYTYMTENFTYDYEKAQTVEADYIPHLDEVYDASNGICFDYSALFAAMARSQGIPTRLIMGYEAHEPETYHAWNQVFLKDSNEWVTIDTTYDAIRKQGGETTPMIKDTANYEVSKMY